MRDIAGPRTFIVMFAYLPIVDGIVGRMPSFGLKLVKSKTDGALSQLDGAWHIKKWCMAEPPHLHNVAPRPNPMLSPPRSLPAMDSVNFLFVHQILSSARSGRAEVHQRQD
jgi:hypothetical protein